LVENAGDVEEVSEGGEIMMRTKPNLAVLVLLLFIGVSSLFRYSQNLFHSSRDVRAVDVVGLSGGRGTRGCDVRLHLCVHGEKQDLNGTGGATVRSSDLIAISPFPSTADAQIAKGILDEAWIESMVRADRTYTSRLTFEL